MAKYLDSRLLHGDCIDKLKDLDDASIDAIVTDPPYELGLMGKKWDASGIAYNIDLWSECLRVLKPGGHLLAFGGTRTYHRMACAIEDAGFEIRDSIHWSYSTGFPKSHNVSKTLTKDGNEGAAAEWAGWGTALKPSHEPIVVARKPLAGTVAVNVLAHGTGALNIDGSRVSITNETDAADFANNHAVGERLPDDYDGAKTGCLEGGWKYQVGKKETPPGRWPANTLLTHAPDCAQVGTRADNIQVNVAFTAAQQSENWGTKRPVTETVQSQSPVFQCVPGCPVLALDQQTGVLKSGLMKAGTKTQGYTGPSMGEFKPGVVQSDTYADAGGASRFFHQTEWDEQWDRIVYFAKPSKREKNAGVKQGNIHPTTKPVALMRYLITLVTPPGGTVLDPFLGSGTTAVAAILDGYDWKGCELTDDYLPIIKGRVAHARSEVRKRKAA